MSASVRALLGSGAQSRPTRIALIAATALGLALGDAPPVRSAVADYSLQYIERMPVQTPSSSLGVVPFGIVPAYFHDPNEPDDGQWIYYQAACGYFPGTSTALPGCPTIGGVPDFHYHARRVRIDGTDEECLTCGSGTAEGNLNFGRHSGSPEVHGDYMIFSRERHRWADPEQLAEFDDDYDDTYEDADITVPDVSCGAGVTAPGGGWWHDLYVMRLSTGYVSPLYESVAESGETPGLLDPRWSDDGKRIVWAERQKTGTGVNNRLGDWRMRVASSFPDLNDDDDDLDGGDPHLHGNAQGHGTSPTSYDPGGEGIRITGGFTRDGAGSLSGVYFAGNPKTGQDPLADDIGVVGFASPTSYADLTNTSGVGTDDSEYEEHAHLNQKYWDAIVWMTSDPYGSTDPQASCLLQDLKTELYLMAPDGSSKTRVSFYNDGTNWQGQNPGDDQTIVSKLAWAPNGVDAAVSVNFVIGQNQFDNHIAIYHFKRLQNPTDEQVVTGNGFETNPTHAFADGGGWAVNANGTTQAHEFDDFDLSIPKTVDPSDIVIDGFDVRLDWWTDSATHSPYLAVRLWDGSAWSSWKTTPIGSTSQQQHTISATVAQWGGSWTAADLLNNSFKIQVAADCVSQASCISAGRDFNLDWVSVKAAWHVN